MTNSGLLWVFFFLEVSKSSGNMRKTSDSAQRFYNSNNGKKIKAFRNSILDKSKYIIKTFQTGKLSFLAFYDRQNCWTKKWREPLEAYYQASKIPPPPQFRTLKLLLGKKKSENANALCVIFSKRRKKECWKLTESIFKKSLNLRETKPKTIKCWCYQL